MVSFHVLPELVRPTKTLATIRVPTGRHPFARMPSQVGTQMGRLLVLLATARVMAYVHQLLASLLLVTVGVLGGRRLQAEPSEPLQV